MGYTINGANGGGALGGLTTNGDINIQVNNPAVDVVSTDNSVNITVNEDTDLKTFDLSASKAKDVSVISSDSSVTITETETETEKTYNLAVQAQAAQQMKFNVTTSNGSIDLNGATLPVEIVNGGTLDLRYRLPYNRAMTFDGILGASVDLENFENVAEEDRNKTLYLPLIFIEGGQKNNRETRFVFEVFTRESAGDHPFFARYVFQQSFGTGQHQQSTAGRVFECLEFNNRNNTIGTRFDDIVYFQDGSDSHKGWIYIKIRKQAGFIPAVNLLQRTENEYSNIYLAICNEYFMNWEGYKNVGKWAVDANARTNDGQSPKTSNMTSEKFEAPIALENENGTIVLPTMAEPQSIAPSQTNGQYLKTENGAVVWAEPQSIAPSQTNGQYLKTENGAVVWADIPQGSGGGNSTPAGFESYQYIEVRGSDYLQPQSDYQPNAVLIMAKPTASFAVRSMSVVITQASERSIRFAIYNTNRQLIAQTQPSGMNQTGLKTIYFDNPVTIDNNTMYLFGILTSGNGYRLAGRWNEIPQFNILPLYYQSNNNLDNATFPQSFNDERQNGNKFIPYFSVNA